MINTKNDGRFGANKKGVTRIFLVQNTVPLYTF